MSEFDIEIEEASALFESFELAVTRLRLDLSTITATMHNVGMFGISKNDVVRLESANCKITSYDLPLATFTEKPSTVNLVHAGESVLTSLSDGFTKLFSFIFKLIGGIFKAIGKFFKWVVAKITGRKTSTAAAEETLAVLNKASAAEVLSFLTEDAQKALVTDLSVVANDLVKINAFKNDKDKELPTVLTDHVKVVNTSCKAIAASVKDTSGTKAAVIEADIANSSRKLLTQVHVSESITIPDFNNDGALLSTYTECLTATQASLKSDIEKVRKDQATEKGAGISAIKTYIGETFDVIQDLKSFESKTDLNKLVTEMDRMTKDIETLGERAEKELSKDKTGVFARSDTAKQLKLTQVTVQRSNQIALIAVQRLACTISLRMAIIDSAFCTHLPKYAKMYLANKTTQKRTTVIDVDHYLKPKGKKKD